MRLIKKIILYGLIRYHHFSKNVKKLPLVGIAVIESVILYIFIFPPQVTLQFSHKITYL